jgi:hypothetical protein
VLVSESDVVMAMETMAADDCRLPKRSGAQAPSVLASLLRHTKHAGDICPVAHWVSARTCAYSASGANIHESPRIKHFSGCC